MQSHGDFKRYVLGFLFDREAENVLLIQKNKPDWQKGRLNGIGGKIEPGEEPLEAMEREGFEEAIIKPIWEEFGVYKGPGYEIFLFRAFDSYEFRSSAIATDEIIHQKSVRDLPWRDDKSMIWNLNWLIPLALDKYVNNVVVSE